MSTPTNWRRRRLIALGLFAVSAPTLLPVRAGAGEDFVAGSGRARASIVEIVPRTGGLTLPISFGRASASYQGLRAEASSVAGRIPTDAPSPAAECGARDPGGGGGGGGGRGGGGGGGASPPNPITQNPLTSTIRVTSDDKDSEAGRKAQSFAAPAGSPVRGAGSDQEVVATDDPSARATTVEGRLGVLELVDFTMARAESRSGVMEGKSRLAHAVVTMDRLDLLEGLISFEQVRWEATQRSGDGAEAEGAFSFGRVAVGGTPLPGPPPGAGEGDPFAPLNEALAPTGLALVAPEVEKVDDVVRVSPMTLRLSDSPIGRATLGPALGALQPVRDPLVEALLSFSCDLGSAVLVADVIASIASGSGGVSLDVGGVSATTEGTRYDNPFDGPLGDPFGATPPDVPLPAYEPPSALPAEDFLTAPFTTEPSVLPAYRFAPSLEMAAPAPAAPAPPEVAFAQPVGGPSSRRLAGDTGGAALAVGIIGLLAVLGLAAADALHLRRAARSIP